MKLASRASARRQEVCDHKTSLRRMDVTPLAGVRVLDLTTFLSGPYCALVLRQLGAEIIKVEPLEGEPTRGGSPEPVTDFWFALHRGRRSIALDLKRDEARDVFFDLARTADVVVENYRPGVTKRLGIDPDTLRGINPRLITCAINGYGTEGELAGAAAIDGVVQAFCGSFIFPTIWGLPEGPIPFQVADIAGGTAAAHAILAALYTRERTGTGAHLQLSLAECLLNWINTGDRTGTLRSPNTILATGSDGGRFVVQTTLHFRTKLAAMLGLTFEATEDYAAQVRSKLSTNTKQYWLQRLAEVGVPAAPIQTIADALAHPDIANEVVDGRMMPASPFVINGDRHATPELPPSLGEHTIEVLRDVLGYDSARIDSLSGNGAIRGR